MIPERFADAVEAARIQLSAVGGVQSIVLFGSAARGTATEDSDIDILIECPEEAEDAVRRVLYDLGSRYDVRFSPVFFREAERHRFDTQFLESIVRSGHVLKGVLPRLTPVDLDLQPLRLVSYRTKGLSPKKRARLLRAIDGYRTEKRVAKKRYVVERRGFLQDVGGWRVGRGAVIVPEESADALDELLHEFGATRVMVPIWCQRP